MDQEIALFIGGPCDGMRIKVHTDMARVTLERLSRMAEDFDFLKAGSDAPATCAKITESYERQRIRSDDRDFCVYVYHGTDVIQALIAGYRESDSSDVWA
jgi:hypothetical protein